MSDALQKTEVPAKALLAGRQAIKNSPELAALFVKAKEDNWTQEFLTANLSVRLSAYWGGVDFALARAVSQVLVQEYDATLEEGTAYSLVDPNTGRTVQRFTQDDVWLPAPVPREGGGMAQPLPRLRPEIEGALVHHEAEKERVAQIVADAKTTLVQTEGQVVTGDTRLSILTRDGRHTFIQGFRERLQERVLAHPVINSLVLFGQGSQISQGAGSLVYEHLTQDAPDLVLSIETPIRIGVQDLRAINLRYDFQEHLLQSVLTAWLQTLGESISRHFQSDKQYEVADSQLFSSIRCSQPTNTMLAPSDLVASLRREVGPDQIIVPIPEDIRANFVVSGPVARIYLDFNDVGVTHTEYHDKVQYLVRATLNLHWLENPRITWFGVPSVVTEVRAEVVKR